MEAWRALAAMVSTWAANVMSVESTTIAALVDVSNQLAPREQPLEPVLGLGREGDDDVFRWARFYMEPVDDDGSGVTEAVRRTMGAVR